MLLLRICRVNYASTAEFSCFSVNPHGAEEAAAAVLLPGMMPTIRELLAATRAKRPQSCKASLSTRPRCLLASAKMCYYERYARALPCHVPPVAAV